MRALVVPWSSRYRLGLPLALAILGLVLFVAGMASHDVRTDPSFQPYLWTSLGVGIVFSGIWLIARRLGGRRLIVDDRGIRIGALDFGAPTSVRTGLFDQLMVYGRGPLKRHMTPHAWISIEGDGGKSVVLMRMMGRLGRLPDWPRARPPRVDETFDCGTLDIVAVRGAIGRLIR